MIEGLRTRSIARQQSVLGAVTAGLTVALVKYVSPFDSYLREMSNADRSDLYQLAGQIGATLLGFGIAAITILISIPDSTRFSLFSRSKWYGLVLTLFLGATTWSLLWTSVSVVGLVADRTGTPSRILVIAFVVFAIESLLHVAGCLVALLMIIDLVVIDRRASAPRDEGQAVRRATTAQPNPTPTSATEVLEGFD